MRGERGPGHWRGPGRQAGAQGCRQSGCPTALGSPCPTCGAQWGLSRRILGSCTGLMQAIHVLVLASKDLQREIVESGRVSRGQGCKHSTGQQELGQPWVTAHLQGTCCPKLGLLGHQRWLPGASAPAPASRHGHGPWGVTEVPDPPSHVGDPVTPWAHCLPSCYAHPK